MKKSKSKPKAGSRPEHVHWPLVTLVLLAVVLAGLTLAVYLQAAGFELTNFDDDSYITENTHLALGLGWQGIRWAFTTNYATNWHPLTWMSLMLDAQMGHGSPRAYHVTNIVLHLLSVLLLYLALCIATRKIWRSAFVAALFAVHPLHAESVAWVAERKDVLSTVFWMLTILVYVRYAGRLTRSTHALLAVVFALGLLAKPMLVSLPLVLLMLDYWPLGRMDPSGKNGPRSSVRDLVWEKAPLFVLATASCAVTYWAQSAGGAVRPFELYPAGVRLANAAVAYVSYLGKAVWPAHLAAFYPHAGSSLPMWQVIGSAAALAALTYAAIRYRKEAPCVFVGWLWYVVTLIPVIGIIQVGDQAMADRYTYVPLIGIFMMVAWLVPALARTESEDGARILTRARTLGVLGMVIVLALAFAAHGEVGYWRSSKTLFEHAIRVIPRNALAYNNLGGAMLDDANNAKNPEPAIRCLRKSLEIRPNYFEALYNLGTALGKTGKSDEALNVLRKALEIRPNAAKVHNNLGMIFMTQRRLTQAEAQFREATRLEPDLSQAYNNLGYALYLQGRYEEAIPPATKAFELDPDYVQAHINVGNAQMHLRRYAEAVAHYTKVIELDPRRASTRNNLASAYEQLGRTDDALAQLQTGLEIQPNNAAIRGHYERLMASRNPRP